MNAKKKSISKAWPEMIKAVAEGNDLATWDANLHFQ